MAVKAKKGAVSKANYDVQGSTLQEVWKDIEAKGPKVDGKSVAGLTSCKLTGVNGLKYKFESKENKGVKEVEARLENGVVQFTCSIKLPKLVTLNQLSPEGKKAWTAFITGVAKHELEHVTDFEKEVNKMAKEMEAIRAKGKDKDEGRAKRAAQKEWEKTYKKDFAPDKNKKRLKETAKKLDSKTGHGPKLDLSIP